MSPAHHSGPLLAIDTAGDACSVCLLLPSGQMLERHTSTPRRHAQNLLPFVDSLLTEANIGKAEIGVLACGTGPGSFTGLRIAIAVSQGLALALDKKIVPIGNLQAVAWAAVQHETGNTYTKLLAAVDARMGEIYAQYFSIKNNWPEATSQAFLCTPGELLQHLRQSTATLCGTAHETVAALRALPENQPIVAAASSARGIACLAAARLRREPGCAIPAETLQPVYVRENVTHQSGRQSSPS